MKKFILFASALAGLFLAGSCQRENLEPVQQGNKVVYTVQIADAVATKALGDDITAVDELVYEVYRTEEEEVETFTGKDNLLYHRTADVNNGVATIELELVNDQNYTVLFWAHVKDNGVYNVDNLTAVSITSPDDANNVNAQAFVGRDFVIDCVSQKGGKVLLTRPVSQLNIGTTKKQLTDAFDDPITITGSSVTVTGLSTSYNVAKLLAGESSEAPYVYEYDESYPLPTEDLIVNGTAYKYVAMNYLGFPAENGSTVTVKYVINTSEGDIDNLDAPISNVPVKANYRTNIIGNLITSMSDYTITLDKEWDGIYETVEVWNGSEVNEPKKSATDENIYEVEYPSELAWLAAAVNGTLPETKAAVAAQDFAGKTFKLMNDIDLCGYEWTPIGNGSGKHFTGTFDGQGHTIKGMTITKHAGKNPKALFGIVSGTPTIKNLVIDGASVAMPAGFEGDFYAAGLVGTYYGTLTVENVTVKNSTFAGNNKVAGLLAHDGVCSNLKIDNCHVQNCDIRSTNLVDGGNVGGLLGLFQGGKDGQYKISNSSVKNSTIVGINSSNTGKRANGEFVACISSKAGQTLVIENCVVENNTFSQTINGTEPVTYVGPYDNKFVGGERNGYDVLPGVVIIDGAIYVTTAANLQAVLDAATDDITIKFGADIDGDVTLVQKPDVKVTILGEGKKYDGTIKVHSNSEHYVTAGLTVKNVNFETSKVYYDSENKPYFHFIEALENGSERYSVNITAEECTFTGVGDAVNAAVGLQIKSSKNAKVLTCTATNVHSLIQAQSCDEKVEVIDCTVNGKNGVAFKQVKAATVEGTTINATAYGIRFDGNTDNYGIVVKNNEVTAAQPFIVRKMTGKNNTITLEGNNTLNTEAAYQIVITNGQDDADYVKPTGTYTLTGADNYTIYPEPFTVATWSDFTAALAAGETDIKLTEDITYDQSYTLTKNVTINLNGKTLTIGESKDKPLYIQSNSTIKNGTIKGKVYPKSGNVNLFDIIFAGAMNKSNAIEAQLQIKSGNIYVKGCQFKASGASTRPVTVEGRSSGSVKFESCKFTATQSWGFYANSITGSATLEILNCTFNKAPSIDVKDGIFSTLILSGNTNSFTFTLKGRYEADGLKPEDEAAMRSVLNNNPKFMSIKYYFGDNPNKSYIIYK